MKATIKTAAKQAGVAGARGAASQSKAGRAAMKAVDVGATTVDVAQKTARAFAGDVSAMWQLGVQGVMGAWRHRKKLWTFVCLPLIVCCCGGPFMFLYFMFGGLPAAANGCRSEGAPGELISIADGKNAWPLAGEPPISSHYRNAARPGHRGVDFGVGMGTPVFAAAAGKVIAKGPAQGFGYWVVIDSVTPGGTQTFSTVYGHMPEKSIKVKVNDLVRAGQHIADVGNEGDVWGSDGKPVKDKSTGEGAHLHFEVWLPYRMKGDVEGDDIDPIAWLEGRNDKLASKPAEKLRAGVNRDRAPATTSPTPTANPADLAASTATVTSAPSTGTSTDPSATAINVANSEPFDPNKAAENQDLCGFGTAGATLKQGVITGPDAKEFEKWIMAAVIKRERFDPAKCPSITAPLLAAQLRQEGGFNVNARNARSGADGPAQFMPDTWNGGWGKDYDGDGKANTRSIADAVLSQADFMCKLQEMTLAKVESGVYKDYPNQPQPPDLSLDYALAAYNCCGENLPGLPVNPANWSEETKDYVPKIRAGAADFTDTTGDTIRPAANGGDLGALVVEHARQQARKKLPYSWGGGNKDGPSYGIADSGFDDRKVYGFDCSGLTQYAVWQAARVDIGSTTYEQRPRGRAISLASARPGDLVFNAQNTHVGVYIGNNRMIHAPSSGQVVQESPIGTNTFAYTYDLGKASKSTNKDNQKKA